MDHNYAAMAKLPSLPAQSNKVEGIAKAKELVRNNFNQPIEPIRESHFSPLFNSKRSPRKRSRPLQQKVNVVQISMASRQKSSRQDDLTVRQWNLDNGS